MLILLFLCTVAGSAALTESWCCRASFPPGRALARCPPGQWHLRVFTAVRWS